MRIGESSSMRLKFVDYIYVLFSLVAGTWEVLCLHYGRDNAIAIILVLFMGFPFAIVSYIHALSLSRAGNYHGRQGWKGLLILWMGMPVSFTAGALSMAAATAVLYSSGSESASFPFDVLRLFGEGVACLAWAACLRTWSSQTGVHLSRNRLFVYFVFLFVGAIAAQGISMLVFRSFQKDLYWFLESTVVTTSSALILIFARNKATGSGENSDHLASEA
jgi:hypothetical protein